jgi:hypothetical protein
MNPGRSYPNERQYVNKLSQMASPIGGSHTVLSTWKFNTDPRDRPSKIATDIVNHQSSLPNRTKLTAEKHQHLVSRITETIINSPLDFAGIEDIVSGI